MNGVIKYFYSILMVAFVFGAQAQTNYNDPYNNLGNPQNPNNLLQQTGNPVSDTTAEDTAKAVKEKFAFRRNPLIASLASTVMPGLGQIYNGKIWKVPLFWGLLGTFGYFVADNNRQYQDYRNAFIYLNGRDPNDILKKLSDDPVENNALAKAGYNEIYSRHNNQMLAWSVDSLPTGRSGQILQNNRDYTRRNRDWMVVFFLLTYVCNIMDASVDAHFANFDVSDKLSMKIEPSFISPNGLPQVGLNMNFSFTDNRRKKIISRN